MRPDVLVSGSQRLAPRRPQMGQVAVSSIVYKMAYQFLVVPRVPVRGQSCISTRLLGYLSRQGGLVPEAMVREWIVAITIGRDEAVRILRRGGREANIHPLSSQTRTSHGRG
jgi:hypothetical protein